MSASSIPLLERRLAYLPGTSDPQGGPLMVVCLPPHDLDLGALSCTIKYLKTVPK